MSRQGFTLIEILTVILIITIVVLINAPYLTHYIRYNNLKSGTREVVQILRLAQQNTVAEQIKYSVRFSPLGETYYLIKKTTPEQTVNTYTLPNLTISEIQGFNDNEAVFDPSGAVEFSGEVHLSHPQISEQTLIEVRPAGFISWHSYEP